MSSQSWMEKVQADVGLIVGSCQLEYCMNMGDAFTGRTHVTLKLFGDCNLQNLIVKLPDGRTMRFPKLDVVKIQLDGLALPVFEDGQHKFFDMQDPEPDVVTES